MKLYRKQSGAVLAISLVMLTAITFLALMNMQRSGLQTRIVANIQQKEMVFNECKTENESAFGEYRDFSTERLALSMEENGGPLPTEIVRARHPEIDTDSFVRHKIVAAAQGGNPVTSRLRNDFSRGMDGAGVEEFELSSRCELRRSRTASNQLLGFTFYSPK